MLFRSKKLVPALPASDSGLQMTMDVRVYREKPVGKEAPKGTAQALWAYLLAQNSALTTPANKAG